MGQGQFKTIQTYGQTSGNTGIMVIKEHKICVALSESLYWKHAKFQVFDSAFVEKAIAPPSDGSGSILNHSNIRSDIRQHWHYGH